MSSDISVQISYVATEDGQSVPALQLIRQPATRILLLSPPEPEVVDIALSYLWRFFYDRTKDAYDVRRQICRDAASLLYKTDSPTQGEVRKVSNIIEDNLERVYGAKPAPDNFWMEQAKQDGIEEMAFKLTSADGDVIAEKVIEP